jgi:putative ABC transport system permease protein
LPENRKKRKKRLSPLPARTPLRLAVAIRFALRELRGGLRGFGVFLACIVLGVAAVAAVASLARGMNESIAREGQALLGADIDAELVHRRADAAELAYLESLGKVSLVATMRAMSRRADGDDGTLVELKAVDRAYPLFGRLIVDGDAVSAAVLNGDRQAALVDPELLVRLDLTVGDAIEIGAARLTIRGTIDSEPDRLSGGLSFGPRVMIGTDALEDTGLIRPGSLVDWHYRMRLGGNPDNAEVAGIREAISARFPEAGWDLDTRVDAAPGLRRNVTRLAEFLTLIGLTALIVGGVGVANAVSGFLETKRDVIATFGSLGAPPDFAVAVYLIQILILTGLGIVIGLAAGASIALVGGVALRIVLPVVVGFYPLELAVAALYGLATALAFALYPLGRVREVSPTGLFRDQVAPSRSRPAPAFLVATALAVLFLAALAIGLAFDRRIATIFVVAAAAAFLLLRLVANAIMALAWRAPQVRSTGLRLALGNIRRPGALTPSIVLSLGLGLTLVVTLVLIDGNLRRSLVSTIPGAAPSFFFLDIHDDTLADFEALIAREAPEADLAVVPLIRGRVTEIDGVPASEFAAPPNVRWVLTGDRGITYSATAPETATLDGGEWWPADYDGPPLVSMEREIAEGLGLDIGDTITVNVLGRPVTATVANLRTVEWQSIAINFVMIFSPDAFRGAPFTSLATLTFPGGATDDRELALLKTIADALPGVTSVRIKEALETVNGLVVRVGWAVGAASSITLAAAILVLAGAFAAGRRQRIHDAVVLKTLGATRSGLIGAFVMEFLGVGLATAVFGVLAGAVAAWYVLTNIMEIDFGFLVGPVLGATGLSLALILGVGLAGTWRVLGQKPAPVLRNL